jgi:HEAT repeat protein
MTIELLMGVAAKAVVGSAAGKLAGVAIDKGKAKLFPGELEKALSKGIDAAQAQDARLSPTSWLFYRCDDKQQKDCLSRVMEHSATLQELRKPLEKTGEIETACLVKVFQQVAQELKLSLVEASLDRWVKTFAEQYFEQTSTAIQFQVTKEHYLKQLAQRVDDVKFVGIAVSGEEEQVDLANIFVMPNLREERPSYFSTLEDQVFESQQAGLLEEQRAWARRDRRGQTLPAQQVLSFRKNKAVLLGAPGSGKTTLVNYFALMLSGQAMSDPTQIGLSQGEDWLPIVVRIRDWALEPKLGLLAYLRWYATESLAVKALPEGFFEHWLERGRSLILLDGLDEVVDEGQRRRIVEQIETFLHQYQENPAVITSRPAGYRWDFFNLEEFPHYTLEPFDERQRNLFIDHWYSNRERDPAKAERRKADLCKALKGKDRLRLLAKNPLLLTIIALIHRYQAELPRQRFKLYEKAVETLLTSWDSGKDLKLYEVLQYLKPDDLLYVLKKLAYWIHTQGNAGETEGGTLIDREVLIRQLCKEICELKGCRAYEGRREAERFVEFVQRRTGLLNEQGRERYAFVHKTFQEYLTAEEIYDLFEEGEDEIILEHIQRHLHDQHWREVLLLLVSRLKKRRAAESIREILESGSEYEQWLHRDLLFAGWCLTEDPHELKKADTSLTDEILDRLVALETSSWKRVGRRVHNDVGKILHRLGETTMEAEAWSRLQAQSQKIARFRLLKFQASLGQEQAAIATLLSLLKDDDSKVRSSAVDALGELDNASPEVVNSLLSLLKDDDSGVRSTIAIALGKLGNNVPPEVVNSLLRVLKSDALGWRSHTAVALGKLGNASPEVVNSLLSLLKNNDSEVRFRAADALSGLGNASPEVVNSLLSLLKDDDSKVRSSAADALSGLGNASPEVVNSLLNLLKDDDLGVCFRAVDGLGKLGNTSPEVVSSLLSSLKDNDSLVRSSVVYTLGKLGSNAPPEVVSSLAYSKTMTLRCVLMP